MRSDRLKGIRILYEDDILLVVEKPAGMLSTHTFLRGRAAREAQLTAQNVLSDYLRKGQLKSNKRAYLVHRLDRETSGVMMFAKSEAMARKLREHWNETTEKTYLARVEGELENERGVYESYLREDDDGYRVRSVKSGGKLSRTEWRRRDDGIIEIKLHSGRKNQIRVHFSEHGHPIVGDVKYGAKKAPRMFLHALRLGFIHPASGKHLEFESGCAW